MKGDFKEILAKLKPETSIEELISYCDTLDDFNKIFEEYCKAQFIVDNQYIN